ncbi:hypothetical protein CBL_11430 [Carabus blaptoides fortunei]
MRAISFPYQTNNYTHVGVYPSTPSILSYKFSHFLKLIFNLRNRERKVKEKEKKNGTKAASTLAVSRARRNMGVAKGILWSPRNTRNHRVITAKQTDNPGSVVAMTEYETEVSERGRLMVERGGICIINIGFLAGERLTPQTEDYLVKDCLFPVMT